MTLTKRWEQSGLLDGLTGEITNQKLINLLMCSCKQKIQTQASQQQVETTAAANTAETPASGETVKQLTPKEIENLRAKLAGLIS